MQVMFIITLALGALLLAAFYLYFTRTFDYWTKRGIKHDKPCVFFGSNMKNLLRVNFAGLAAETYRKHPNERIVGLFRGNRPELVIRDLELAKDIMTRDFKYFHRRGLVDPATLEPLRRNQAFADDDLWRQLRLRMTPAFSSGKLKAMFPLILQRAESLQTRLRVRGCEHLAIDAKDLMVRFTNDIIGSVGFGIASDSLNNDGDAMRQLGIKIFSNKLVRMLKQILKNTMPKIFHHVKIYGDIETEVINVVRSVLQQRNYEPNGRHDFIDLLLESKKKGAMIGDSIIDTNSDGTPKKVSIVMDDQMMAAQCFFFFGAGFETSSMTSSYTLHELAHNLHIQEKVQKEIETVLAQYNDKLCYESISDMTYLQWAFKEAMRIFPAVGTLFRRSVLPYTFPGTAVTIDAGVPVFIPLEAYQNDPTIFPEPMEYRPERFDPETMTPAQKLAYLPFGAGPRACIGERLGVMQSLAGLAAVLREFSVRPAPGAPRRPSVSPVSVVVTQIEGGLPLIFQKRDRYSH